jgi:putative ABC transport system permease protein
MRVPETGLAAAVARVTAVPGVTRVTVSSGMLGSRGGSAAVRVRSGEGPAIAMSRVPIGAAFFDTLGLPVLRGRSFDAAELGGHARVVVLTESAARALSPSRDPIGLTVRLDGHASISALVIGVCRDAIDYGALSRAGLMPPAVFVPYEPSPQDPVILARVAADPHRALRAIADAGAVPGRPRPEPGVLGDETAFAGGATIEVRILWGFALIALLLAGTGVYSATSQSVAQRRREFGIRLAIGASPRRVLALVLAREARLIGAAIATGAVFTFALTRVMFVELAVLSATAPAVWIALVGLCGGVAALSVLLATYRITRLEPSAVLRRT